MLKHPQQNSDITRSKRARRALLITNGRRSALRSELLASGLEVSVETIVGAHATIGDYAPDVAIFELPRPGDTSEKQFLAFARRLRTVPATYSLPLIFCWQADDLKVRNALLYIGADDYFPLSTSIKEIMTRLDSLFWRIEAGRRPALTAGDHCLEIDNFMLVLDSVREDLRNGMSGTIGILNAVNAGDGPPLDRTARDRTLNEAHGFLKLNLRRVDSVTYYGPSTLLIYMPRMSLSRALERVNSLRHDFLFDRPDQNIAIGLASCSSAGETVETTIEKAEESAAAARKNEAQIRVVAFGLAEEQREEKAAQSSEETRHPEVTRQPESREQQAKLEAPRAPGHEPSVGPEAKTHAETRAIILDEGANEIKLGTELVATLFPPDSAPQIDTTVLEGNPEQLAERSDIVPDTSAEPKPERKTFFSKGFDQSSVREMSMADIMKKVAATRVRQSPLENGVSDLRPDVAVSHELAPGQKETATPRRLLLVMSETKRMAALNALVRSAGYEARAAFNGNQALDLLRLERPDVLIVDYHLSGMDGLETLRRLRKQNPGRQLTPVVILVSDKEAEVRNEAAELGVYQVIDSNYEPAELLSSIRQVGNRE